MGPQFKKLKTKLAELFELDKADLDFGIYRVLRQRHQEISEFLDHKLTSVVQSTLTEFAASDTASLKEELATAIEGAKSLDVDPDSVEKVKELRARLEETPDSSEIEEEIYSHLLTFFSRYYEGGDFISQRRYKGGDSYAIPYDGEEVKLVWANMDQYYIKSSEHLRDYTFRWKPLGEAAEGELALEAGEEEEVIVRFKLVEGDTEKDNRKSSGKSTRAFALDPDSPFTIDDRTLLIRFTYREHPSKKNLQDHLNKDIVKTLADSLPEDWKKRLYAKAPTEKNKDRTVLEKHLQGYTAKYQFDYFIHKDLGGFLRRELDFYLKNEVMHLDDIESETAPRAEEFLNRLRAIRRVATPVIEMLEQLENFQKKLWLKKKFVVETRYVMTLDRVPEELYDEILECDVQWEEWQQVVSLSEAEGFERTTEFLRSQSLLAIDTKHFSSTFTEKLLTSFSDLQSDILGLCVSSDNSQALNFVANSLKGGVNAIYIDPPYNSDASSIDYKNGYKGSSWTTLINQGLVSAKPVLARYGVMGVAIDDVQTSELTYCLKANFSPHFLGTICVRSNPSGRPMQTGYSVAHEYLHFSGATEESNIGRLPANEEQERRFNQSDNKGRFEWRNLRREGSNSDRAARPKLYYPIYLTGKNIRVPEMVWNENSLEWSALEEPNSEEEVAWPLNANGDEKTWRWGNEKVSDMSSEIVPRTNAEGTLYPYLKRRPNEDGVAVVSSWFDAKYSSTEHGTALIKKLFGRASFSYPKSIHAVEDAIYISGARKPDAVVLDYFAGSGTTGHAVLNLNRADGGHRRFALVEMGEHFEGVIVPRLKKVMYSNHWEDGIPLERSSGLSYAFKIIRLESYEDCMNNLSLSRSDAQSRQLDQHPEVKDDYMLRYFLDVESQDSLLNTQIFHRPCDYQLDIATSSAGETVPTKVDLVETFNWLLGLKVKHLDFPKGFVTVTGTDREEKDQILIIWRNLDGDDAKDHEALTQFLDRQQINPADTEYDAIYLNGPHTLDDPFNKIRLTEEHFHRLMFEGTD